MKNDNFEFKPEYTSSAQPLLEQLFKLHLTNNQSRLVVSIAGQSGSGKTVLAHALRLLLKKQKCDAFILFQDDYFHLPPRYNHLTRLTDISWVGTQEVNLSLLNKHIVDYKKGQPLYLPEMDFHQQHKTFKEVASKDSTILIVEGTYVSLLDHIDHRVYINTSHENTLKNRAQRGRDMIDDYTEKILAIEAELISTHIQFADTVLNSCYQVVS